MASGCLICPKTQFGCKNKHYDQDSQYLNNFPKIVKIIIYKVFFRGQLYDLL
jgi:hypothetical protein